MSVPSPYTLVRSAPDIAVVNSTTETTILSYAIPAGYLGSDRSLRVLVLGDYKSFAGASTDFQIRVNLGAVEMNMTSFACASVNAHYGLIIDAMISQVDASLQYLHAMIGMKDDVRVAYGSSVEDESTELTLEVTMKMDTANANNEFNIKYLTIEIL